jgi:hypothetical protein
MSSKYTHMLAICANSVTSLWLQKAALLNFFVRNFLPTQRGERHIAWIYGVVFTATLVAAQIVGFTECDPFHLYWQVVPAPGTSERPCPAQYFLTRCRKMCSSANSINCPRRTEHREFFFFSKLLVTNDINSGSLT